MILLDANVLIYAIDADAVHHKTVRRWLETVLSGSAQVGMAWVVVLAFLRITTHPKVMRKPLTPQAAMAYLDEWFALPCAGLVVPGERHWAIMKNLIAAAGTAGNLTTDVHLAALAIERGYAMASTDNDFRRFAGLKCINPLG
ncbi:MAG TPA: type II toxin-antitoxin system VapC family toxin [Rubrivivax sp.]|nr:type II toxin-antitoxin system VapC family toxin [Rubrivivax sp.]HPO20449.1 type II toxin-antitoxin system VapC family toxin [Rubrivivax sp.]